MKRLLVAVSMVVGLASCDSSGRDQAQDEPRAGNTSVASSTSTLVVTALGQEIRLPEYCERILETVDRFPVFDCRNDDFKLEGGIRIAPVGSSYESRERLEELGLAERVEEWNESIIQGRRHIKAKYLSRKGNTSYLYAVCEGDHCFSALGDEGFVTLATQDFRSGP